MAVLVGEVGATDLLATVLTRTLLRTLHLLLLHVYLLLLHVLLLLGVLGVLGRLGLPALEHLHVLLLLLLHVLLLLGLLRLLGLPALLLLHVLLRHFLRLLQLQVVPPLCSSQDGRSSSRSMRDSLRAGYATTTIGEQWAPWPHPRAVHVHVIRAQRLVIVSVR